VRDPRRLRAGLIEARAEQGHPDEEVAQEVHPAALPAGLGQDRRDRPLEPQVVIADDQPDSAQAPVPSISEIDQT